MMEAETGEMKLTASQGMTRIVGKCQKLGRGKGRIVPYGLQKEHGSANAFISDSKPLELIKRINFFALSHLVCGIW